LFSWCAPQGHATLAAPAANSAFGPARDVATPCDHALVVTSAPAAPIGAAGAGVKEARVSPPAPRAVFLLPRRDTLDWGGGGGWGVGGSPPLTRSIDRPGQRLEPRSIHLPVGVTWPERAGPRLACGARRRGGGACGREKERGPRKPFSPKRRAYHLLSPASIHPLHRPASSSTSTSRTSWSSRRSRG